MALNGRLESLYATLGVFSSFSVKFHGLFPPVLVVFLPALMATEPLIVPDWDELISAIVAIVEFRNSPVTAKTTC